VKEEISENKIPAVIGWNTAPDQSLAIIQLNFSIQNLRKPAKAAIITRITIATIVMATTLNLGLVRGTSVDWFRLFSSSCGVGTGVDLSLSLLMISMF